MITRYRIHPNMFIYDGNGNVILCKNAYDAFIQSGILIKCPNKNYAKSLNSEKRFRSKNIKIPKVNYNAQVRLIDIVSINNGLSELTKSDLISYHGIDVYVNAESLSYIEKKKIEKLYNRNYKELIRETADMEYISRFRGDIDPLVLEIDDRVMLKLKLITDEKIFVHQYDENVVRCLAY